ncbi:hypothetical protein ACFXGA_18645 [Actinosynnema sp. NPDC059335]|uniref:hypothetical protein n=1 Tax=Actinosynnema sp. NPDC059335 TaxID=3346804 RepID=UPI00366B5697
MAEETSQARPQTRRKDPAAALLAELRQARDREDAKLADRRRQEDEALAAYAKAVVEERQIGEQAAKKVAELEKRIATVREEQERDQAAAVARQAAALTTLVKFRNAAQVGEVVGLSAKRVRALTKDAGHPGPATGDPTAAVVDAVRGVEVAAEDTPSPAANPDAAAAAGSERAGATELPLVDGEGEHRVVTGA